MNILSEFVVFIIKRRKFWLIPAIVTLLLFGTVIALTSGSVLAPFIYSIF